MTGQDLPPGLRTSDEIPPQAGGKLREALERDDESAAAEHPYVVGVALPQQALDRLGGLVCGGERTELDGTPVFVQPTVVRWTVSPVRAYYPILKTSHLQGVRIAADVSPRHEIFVRQRFHPAEENPLGRPHSPRLIQESEAGAR
ncbi:hypothetical protein [Saccharopolyspora phatthalungensis]|uniref:Uncharacterized protein n=1 Tax=Saccharopolyspora phatthalungensis TaxID=664693 RepID=A0A840PX67_9PSEU|nr:hypothetical protein [Saccharopolyspora phatthalungensis]MBB5152504.1 hypothetical protein [Saccharopolyspora phatthalungensis]